MSKNCGLVSISFRSKCVSDIVRLCKKAGLSYIEWGGDVHCPAGDVDKAREVSSLTGNAGLIPYCYGSYFRLGIHPASDFEAVAKSASALGAKTVRLWAYNKKYADCTSEELEMLKSEVKAVSKIAEEYGLFLSFEYHRGCITETVDGALWLFSLVDNELLRIHWQPNPEITAEENLRELSLLPRVDIVHVFAWTYEDGENVRHPLYNHHMTWQEYIDLAKKKNPECIFELEFFKDDSDSQCLEDAGVLIDMI